MGTNQITVEIVYTDLFCGEPNYSWVKRYEMTVPEIIKTSTLARIAKELAGIQGVKGKWESCGDSARFFPKGLNTVLFINF